MSTNYYLYESPPCDKCGHQSEPLHIGKSSFGWCFSLHVDEDLGLVDLASWQRLWESPEATIRNEYGEKIEPSIMTDIITHRSAKSDGWSIQGEANFHERNYSERGPNGLLRHKIGKYCVGHGEGTWDYIRGDFS